MKQSRSITFLKITRAFYLLGVVFLLAGMFLSVANIPAQAGSLADTAAQATRLPPSNPVKPPSVQPPAPKPPVVEPVSPAPGNPGSAPQGPGAQNLNRGPASLATPALRSNPSILATMAPGAAVTFTQADYCYDGPAGEIQATVVITLPENVPQARLSTDWYVVWPRTGAIEHHYFTPAQVFEDGDTYTFTAQWPGIDQWVEGNTVEIHFGAILIDIDGSGPISEGDGLDVYYNGSCNVSPDVQLSHQCQDDGSTLWTLGNPASIPVAYSYTVNGQPGGSGTLAARGSTTFTTTGVSTVVVTFDDGVGGKRTVTATSEDCGGPELEPLTLDHACTAAGITWTVTNPNDVAVSIDWDLDDGDETGSLSVPANSSISVVSSADTASAHSLTITWTGGSDTDTSEANECTVEEAVLVVRYACIEDTETIQWQVSNESTVDTTFTWSLDGGAQSAPVAIEAGETIDVTTSGSGDHTLMVSWPTGNSTSVTSEEGFCVGEEPPVISLSHDCADEDGYIDWFATNDSDEDIDVEWSFDDGDQTGSVTIEAGETVLLHTSVGGEHTMQVTYNENIVVTDESEEGECGMPFFDLTLEHACTAAGITWTAFNSNPVPVDIEWDLDGTQSGGPLTVPANGSISVVSSPDTESAHVLTITYTGGAGFAEDESEADFCTVSEAVLEVLYACIDGTETIQWQVRNTGTAATNFTWSLDGGAANASFIGAGQTINVTTSSSGEHTVAVTWSTGTDSVTSEEGFCTNEEPPAITLDHDCADEEGYIDWFATNDSDEDVEVEWSFDDGDQTGTVTIEAGDTVVLYTSVGGEHTMQVTYDEDIVVTDESEAEECGMPVIEPLEISYACVLGENTLTWTVTNTNDFAVTFNWALDGGAWSTDLVVAANGSLSGFTTSTSTTAHVMQVRWYNAVGGVDGQVERASPAEACVDVTPPPPPSLDLEFACIGTTTNLQWTAVNDGDESVAFTWTKDSGEADEETGSNSAPANGERDFLVTNNEAHIVSITWSTETGTLSVTRSSPAGICNVSTTTTTVTVTPPTTTVTVTPGTSTATTTVTTTPGTTTPETGITTTPGTTTPETGITTVPGTENPPAVGGFQGSSTPGPTSTPIATVGVPITGQGESAAVSPATGGDLSRATGMALWQQILLNGGLLFLGMALIFEGLGRKFR